MILLEDVEKKFKMWIRGYRKIIDYCKDNVEKEFEENSFQRIFFEQIKYNNWKVNQVCVGPY